MKWTGFQATFTWVNEDQDAVWTREIANTVLYFVNLFSIKLRSCAMNQIMMFQKRKRVSCKEEGFWTYLSEERWFRTPFVGKCARLFGCVSPQTSPTIIHEEIYNSTCILIWIYWKLSIRIKGVIQFFPFGEKERSIILTLEQLSTQTKSFYLLKTDWISLHNLKE